MQAVILASGRGTRFRPFTDSLPKPLLPLANRPLLDYLLAALVKAGCTKIFVTLGYAGDQIRQFLETRQGSSVITPVLASDWTQGPLASFQAVIPFMAAQEPFILVPGDLYISAQNLQLLTSTTAEMALLFDPEKTQAGTYIQVNGSLLLHDLIHSAVPLSDYYLSVPALRATPKFLSYCRTIRPEVHSTVFMLLGHWVQQGHPIHGIPLTDKEWCDIDTSEHLVMVNHHLLTAGWPPHPLPPGMYLPAGTSMEGPVQSATVTLGDQSQIRGPVLLGTRVQVGAKCIISDGTTLGASTTVGANSTLAQCITLPHAQVPSNVDLKAAVLDTKGNIFHSQ